jgi:hypothetical protein
MEEKKLALFARDRTAPEQSGAKFPHLGGLAAETNETPGHDWTTARASQAG